MNAAVMVEAHTMPAYTARYVAKYRGQGKKTPGIWDAQAGLFFPRPQYDDIDIGGLCRWLNERNDGYPERVHLRPLVPMY